MNSLPRGYMTADSTHPSLLARLRDTGDQAAWREFDARYGDLIVRYCFAKGLQFSDAEDVRQMVLLSISRVMPQFRYSPQRGTFRSYLGQVVRRAVIAFYENRRPNQRPLTIKNIETIAAPLDHEPADAQWESQWIAHHYRLAMNSIRATYEPKSVAVFERLIAGESVQAVAAVFSLSEQAVHKIKQRIRDRLRETIAQQVRDEGLFNDASSSEE